MVLISISITKGREKEAEGEIGAHWEYVLDRGSHKNSSLLKNKMRAFYCASISFANNNHKHSPLVCLSSFKLYHRHRFGEGPCFINLQMSSAIDGVGRPWVQLG